MEVVKITQKIAMPETEEQQQAAIAAAIAEILSFNGGRILRYEVDRLDDQFEGQAHLHVWIDQTLPSFFMKAVKITQKIAMPETEEQQQATIAATAAEILSFNGGRILKYEVDRLDDQFEGQAYLRVWIDQIPSPVSFERFRQMTASQIPLEWRFSEEEGDFLYRAFTVRCGGAIIRYKNPDVASYDCAGCGVSQFTTVLDRVREKLFPTVCIQQ